MQVLMNLISFVLGISCGVLFFKLFKNKKNTWEFLWTLYVLILFFVVPKYYPGVLEVMWPVLCWTLGVLAIFSIFEKKVKMP